jgi:hypothetical protein
MTMKISEVGPDPGAQTLRFPDVKGLVPGIFHEINPRLLGNFLKTSLEPFWVMH